MKTENNVFRFTGWIGVAIFGAERLKAALKTDRRSVDGL